MKNQEAFTYCWTDHLKNMLYVGCHKGSEDDGYVCSSKWMLEEYTKRPDDFTRQIITEGTYDDCLMLEATILKTADAKNNSDYYINIMETENLCVKISLRKLERNCVGECLGIKVNGCQSINAKSYQNWFHGIKAKFLLMLKNLEWCLGIKAKR